MPPPLPPVLPQHTSSPAPPAPPSYRSPHAVAVASSAGSARKVIMVQQDPGMKLMEDAENLASSRLSNDRRQKSNAHAPDQAQKCPRCESLNTKFCYYNNYSLTQPRHFCKNCRRYWTKGGALRNVPVGGGSRKNKSRVKQRSADPNCLVDEPHMLTQINIGNCSPLLPSFSGPSSSAFADLSNDNQSHRYGLTFSNLQESMRIAEQSGAVPSNQGLFNLGPGSSQIAASLQLNSSSGQPSSLINSMSSFDTSFMQGLGYPNPSPRPDQQSVIYHGSDLGSLFETPTHVAAAVASVPPTLEDHLSSFGMPGSGSGIDPRMRFHQNRAAFQMVNDGHGHEEQGRILRGFDEETQDSLRRMKGRSDVRSLSEWQGVSDNLFESGSDGNFWTLPE